MRTIWGIMIINQAAFSILLIAIAITQAQSLGRLLLAVSITGLAFALSIVIACLISARPASPS